MAEIVYMVLPPPCTLMRISERRIGGTFERFRFLRFQIEPYRQLIGQDGKIAARFAYGGLIGDDERA
jgi:hypothetical protein